MRDVEYRQEKWTVMHYEIDLFAAILLIQSLPFLSAVTLVWLERVSDSKMKKVAAVQGAV